MLNQCMQQLCGSTKTNKVHIYVCIIYISQLLWVRILFLPIIFYCRYVHVLTTKKTVFALSLLVITLYLCHWCSRHHQGTSQTAADNCKSWQGQLLGGLLSRPQPKYSTCCWQQKCNCSLGASEIRTLDPEKFDLSQ